MYFSPKLGASDGHWIQIGPIPIQNCLICFDRAVRFNICARIFNIHTDQAHTDHETNWRVPNRYETDLGPIPIGCAPLPFFTQQAIHSRGVLH